MRALNSKIQYRPKFNDLHHLLKEGKLKDFAEAKANRIKNWKELRYRICIECGEEKLRLMFEGQSNRCKRCKAYNKKKSKKINKERHKEYIRTDKGKDNWCAKQIVYNLKKMGILKKGKCEVCKDINTEAHHVDYNKPWIVMWLCRKHHLEWHKNNKCIYVKK